MLLQSVDRFSCTKEGTALNTGITGMIASNTQHGCSVIGMFIIPIPDSTDIHMKIAPSFVNICKFEIAKAMYRRPYVPRI